MPLDEYKKTARQNNRGEGITTTILALVSLQLRIAADCFQTAADFLGPRYEEGKKKGADYVRIGQDKVNDVVNHGQKKAEQLQKKGEEYGKQGQQKAEQAGQEAQKQAQSAKEEAKKQTNGA